jgi:hypothetical protein
LHPHGRFRILGEKIWTELLESKYATFPPFCYYSHDIEDEIDAKIKELQIIGGGDFMQYNWLLLWLLPPLVSLKIQLYILFGFIICIQIGIHLMIWIGTRLGVECMPDTPIPLIVVSIYGIIIDVITQNLDVDCVKIIE